MNEQELDLLEEVVGGLGRRGILVTGVRPNTYTSLRHWRHMKTLHDIEIIGEYSTGLGVSQDRYFLLSDGQSLPELELTSEYVRVEKSLEKRPELKVVQLSKRKQIEVMLPYCSKEQLIEVIGDLLDLIEVLTETVSQVVTDMGKSVEEDSDREL